MTAAPPSGTAYDLLAVLRRHYISEGRPAGGWFGAEVESPCGARRADALWMPTTHGHRAIVGHEIKVTRTDVLAELADPTKADAWLKYCTRWWLVVAHPDLVRGLEIPEQWGVLSPPSGRRTRTMTVVRDAPKLKPVETGPGFHRLATVIMHREGSRLGKAQQEVTYAKREVRGLRQEIDRLRAGGARPGSPRDQLVARIVAKLDDDRYGAGIPEDQLESAVVAGLTDLAHLHRAASTARWELESLQRNVRSLTEPFAHLGRELNGMKPPTVVWP